MCGIAGLIRPGGLTAADRARVRRLPALLRHRGPDGAGVAFAGDAGLVQTRLALVDLAPHPLPLQSPCGRYTLTYNGELYNFRDLRRELEPVYDFQTRTDTEVALAALIAWGPAAVSRFEGMFAFFLWDAAKRCGFAAVDPLSVKPLLYHASEREFLFCSEAGPLVEGGLLPFRPREEAIAEYLTAPYFSGSHLLPFANLERLLPGHVLELEEGRVRKRRYRWRTGPRRDLLGALRGAVERQSRADAPVGLFLSGGVDSSLLAALAPRPLEAFTIRYRHRAPDYATSLIVRSDDIPPARAVARRFRHPHSIVDSPRYETALRRTLAANDLISAWEQEVSQNLLAEAAARRVKAVLVGDAADETHYGYSFLLHPERLASPRLLLDHFGTVRTHIGADHFVDKYTAFARQEGHDWRTPDSQRLAITSLIRNFWLMRLLHNGDLHLMAHSVEGRVPFADPAVLAAGARVPLEQALRDGIEKHHVRSAAATVLAPEIAWRPKSALTKHLGARRTVHRLFRQAWRRHGALIEPYVYPDEIERLGPPADDRETGLRFRLLALLTWFSRFQGERPA